MTLPFQSGNSRTAAAGWTSRRSHWACGALKRSRAWNPSVKQWPEWMDTRWRSIFVLLAASTAATPLKVPSLCEFHKVMRRSSTQSAMRSHNLILMEGPYETASISLSFASVDKHSRHALHKPNTRTLRQNTGTEGDLIEHPEGFNTGNLTHCVESSNGFFMFF